MYIGKLFDEIDVNVNLDPLLTIFTGLNGSCKTKTMELLHQYFIKNNKQVIYFPANRIYKITDEIIRNVDISQRLSNKTSIIEFLSKEYGLYDEDFLKYSQKHYYNKYIDSGYSQLLNFYYQIYNHSSNNLIVLIDNIERSIHPSLHYRLLDDLLNIDKVSQLFVITYSDIIIHENRWEEVQIKDCLSIKYK